MINESFLLTKENIVSEEEFFNPGWFNPNEFTVYSVNNHPSIFVDIDVNVNSIAKLYISLDTVALNHSRIIYSVLDLLGDLGGLMDAFRIICWTLVNFLTSGSVTNYLM